MLHSLSDCLLMFSSLLCCSFLGLLSICFAKETVCTESVSIFRMFKEGRTFRHLFLHVVCSYGKWTGFGMINIGSMPTIDYEDSENTTCVKCEPISHILSPVRAMIDWYFMELKLINYRLRNTRRWARNNPASGQRLCSCHIVQRRNHGFVVSFALLLWLFLPNFHHFNTFKTLIFSSFNGVHIAGNRAECKLKSGWNHLYGSETAVSPQLFECRKG